MPHGGNSSRKGWRPKRERSVAEEQAGNVRKRVAGRRKGRVIVCSQFSFSRFRNGGRARFGSPREWHARTVLRRYRITIASHTENFSSACIFSLHAEAALVFCECELALLTSVTSSGQRQWRTDNGRVRNESAGRPRRERGKNEFFIAPCHVSVPRDPHNEK